MATQNLSEYDIQNLPTRDIICEQKYAIAVADWNFRITDALLKGAIDTLIECGVDEDNITTINVPGTFELTYAAKRLCDDFEAVYDAVIVLGCVIKGETPHFDYVCQGVTAGITALNVEKNCPVIFGVLTVDTEQQALDRAGGVHGNKGVEAAVTALKMVNIVW